MSGDAQPRKRKDKRRKKGNLEALRSEEYAEESAVFTKIGRQQSKDELNDELLTPTKEPSDEVIHKHKTAELGGNIVTKLVFFALLGGLVFMVGLILVEYRGSTDEETMPAADSQWSLILDDWIEKGADLEHHDEHALHEDHDEHEEAEDHDHGGEEEEGHEEHDEHDDHEEHAEEDEGPGWFSSLYEAYSEQKEESGGGWLSFGKSEEPAEAEEPEPEPEKSSGGWFSFGSTEPPEPEEPTKEPDSEEPEKDTAEEQSVEELIKEEPEDVWTLSKELLDVSEEQEGGQSPEAESAENNESGPEEPEEVKEGDQKNEELTPSEDEEEIEEETPQVVSSAPFSQGPQSVVEDPVEEEVYFNADITNDEDWSLKEELDDADGELNNDRLREALEKYTKILQGHPNSGRARYGKARVLDREAEKLKSNAILLKAIEAYVEALEAPNLTDALFLKIALRTLDRMRFKGLYMKSVQIHGRIIDRFPNEPSYRNNLAINFLMMNRLKDAESTLKGVLDKWPENPVALSHYGLVLKLQGKNKECIPYLEKGLEHSNVPENNDARLYFHLGDALSRLNRTQDAMKISEVFRCMRKELRRNYFAQNTRDPCTMLIDSQQDPGGL